MAKPLIITGGELAQAKTETVEVRALRVNDGSIDRIILTSAGQMQLVETTAPSSATDTGYVYVKDVSTVSQLFYMDSSGVEYQITPVSTTLQDAYEGGNTVAISTAEGPISINNTVDTTNLLDLTRTFAGGGRGINLTMGAATTGDGLYLRLNSGSTGRALVVHDGTSDVGYWRARADDSTRSTFLSVGGTASFAVSTNYVGLSVDITEGTNIAGNSALISARVGGAGRFTLHNSGQLRAIDGTEGAPAYAFVSSALTGMRYITGNYLSFSTAGQSVLQMRRIHTGSSGTETGALFTSDCDSQTGTAAFDALTVSAITTGRTATGALNLLNLSADGSTKMRVDSAGRVFVAPGTFSDPGVSLVGDSNTGIYSPGPDQIGIATGAAPRLTVSTTLITSTLPIDVPLGSVSAPAITFGGTTSGLWSSGSQVNINYNGVNTFSFGSTNLYAQRAGNAAQIGTQGTNSWLQLSGRQDGTGSANPSVTVRQHALLPFIGASIDQSLLYLEATLNQTGTSSFAALRINVTETAVGTGEQALIDALAGATPTSKFKVLNNGRVFVGAGGASIPSLANINDTDTGLYYSTGAVHFSINAAQVAHFHSQGQRLRASVSDILPSLANLSDTTTGIGLHTAAIGVILNSVQTHRFQPDSLRIRETSAPPSGALADHGRVYVKDVSAVSHLYFMDSAGVEWPLTGTAATATLQSAYEADNTVDVSAAQGVPTWTSTDGTGVLALTTTLGQSSGSAIPLHLTSTINQSGTAGYDLIRISNTPSTAGTGQQNAIRYLRTGVLRFRVDADGRGSFYDGSTAEPGVRFVNSETTGFSFGAGVNTLSGSIAGVRVFTFQGAMTQGATGTYPFAVITGDIAQTSLAGYSGLRVQMVETSVGTGARYLVDGILGGATKFAINHLGQFLSVATGEPATPNYSRYGNENTGMYFPTATDQIAWSTAGTQRLLLGTGALVMIGTTQFQAVAGSAGAPGIAFVGALTSGFFYSGGIRAAIGGVQKLQISAAELAPLTTNSYDLGASSLIFRDTYTNRALLGNGTLAAPSLALNSNYGLYYTGGQVRMVSAGTTDVAWWDGGGIKLVQTKSLSVGSNNAPLLITGTSQQTHVSGSIALTSGELQASTNLNIGARLNVTVNQSATASYTAFQINVTETATGSGAKYLIDAQVGGVSQFAVTNAGQIQAVAGSATSPAIIFGDPEFNSGFYAPVNDRISVSCGGAERVRFGSPNVEFFVSPLPSATGTVDLGSSTRVWKDTYSTRVLLADGTSGSPALSFASATTDGFYFSGSALRVALAGNAHYGFFTTAFVPSQTSLDLGSPSLRWADTYTDQVLGDGGSAVATGLTLALDAQLTATSGVQTAVAVTANINQTLTAGYTGFLVNISEVGTGSGTKSLMDLQVGGASKFTVTNTGSVLADPGTQVAPGLSFRGDTTTGFYRSSASAVDLSCGNTTVWAYRNNQTLTYVPLRPGFTNVTDLGGASNSWKDTYSTRVLAGAGTTTLPAYSFAGDLNTGMYWVSSDMIGWSAGGSVKLTLSTSALIVQGGTQLRADPGSIGAPGMAFTGAASANTGLYTAAPESGNSSSAGRKLGISAEATEVFYCDSDVRTTVMVGKLTTTASGVATLEDFATSQNRSYTVLVTVHASYVDASGFRHGVRWLGFGSFSNEGGTLFEDVGEDVLKQTTWNEGGTAFSPEISLAVSGTNIRVSVTPNTTEAIEWICRGDVTMTVLS